MVLGKSRQAHQRTAGSPAKAKLTFRYPSSLINHSTLLLERSSAKLLAFYASTRSRRAVEVIIRMITRDFSVDIDWRHRRLSLSLYYSQKSLTHNIGNASAFPIMPVVWQFVTNVCSPIFRVLKYFWFSLLHLVKKVSMQFMPLCIYFQKTCLVRVYGECNKNCEDEKKKCEMEEFGLFFISIHRTKCRKNSYATADFYPQLLKKLHAARHALSHSVSQNWHAFCYDLGDGEYDSSHARPANRGLFQRLSGNEVLGIASVNRMQCGCFSFEISSLR